MIEHVDIIYGLAWGDEGKGKISNAIAENYDMVCRWNGGPNAGHTVWINNVKYKFFFEDLLRETCIAV